MLKWGTEGSGDGHIKYPEGVAVAPDGNVYVTTYGQQPHPEVHSGAVDGAAVACSAEASSANSVPLVCPALNQYRQRPHHNIVGLQYGGVDSANPAGPPVNLAPY